MICTTIRLVSAGIERETDFGHAIEILIVDFIPALCVLGAEVPLPHPASNVPAGLTTIPTKMQAVKYLDLRFSPCAICLIFELRNHMLVLSFHTLDGNISAGIYVPMVRLRPELYISKRMAVIEFFTENRGMKSNRSFRT